MSPRPTSFFDLKSFLVVQGGGTAVDYRKGGIVFAQGAPAEDVFYIHTGMVKLTVNSTRGKEAVSAILEPGNYFGEECLAGQTVRRSTATALSEGSMLQMSKFRIMRLLREESAFAETFVSFLLSRKVRIEDDLVDLLTNDCERRLARVLLLLADVFEGGKPEQVIPKMSQETLAGIVGTTRPRISFFMNKFRKRGFIEYDGKIKVRSQLQSVLRG